MLESLLAQEVLPDMIYVNTVLDRENSNSPYDEEFRYAGVDKIVAQHSDIMQFTSQRKFGLLNCVMILMRMPPICSERCTVAECACVFQK